jgi:hypothetical protein
MELPNFPEMMVSIFESANRLNSVDGYVQLHRSGNLKYGKFLSFIIDWA